jgi:hypothetical protein
MVPEIVPIWPAPLISHIAASLEIARLEMIQSTKARQLRACFVPKADGLIDAGAENDVSPLVCTFLASRTWKHPLLKSEQFYTGALPRLCSNLQPPGAT